MHRSDRAVAGVLVALLAAVAVAIVWPSALPAAPAPSSSPATAVVYREGILGRPSSVTPLTARTQADRDLVALVFSGLVRRAPDRGYVGELADRWTVDETAKHYTFTLRPEAVWQDGQPVTADDVVFTVHLLQDPAYDGPLAGSWGEVTASAPDSRTVRFDLATPLAGFLEAAMLPILPRHLLAGQAVADLAESDFARHPIGSGHFRLERWDADSALLSAVIPTAAPAATPAAPTSAGEALAGHSAAAVVPAVPGPEQGARAMVPRLPALELRFFQDPDALATAFRNGEIDAAGGLPPTVAAGLAALPATRVLRYPRATLTSIVLDLRPDHPEFRDPRVRTALLQAIDRDALVAGVLDGTGMRADGLIPPSSWAFDPAATVRTAADAKAAAGALSKAGWKRTSAGWLAPGGKVPVSIELASVDQPSNPVAWATAQAVAADWQAIGLTVKVVGFAPAALVSQRLATRRFSAVLLDVNLGLDPDLYPLLASTQAVSGGSNVAGLQDAALDKLLLAARSATDASRRATAYTALQAYLGTATPLLPLYYRDYLFVASARLQGPIARAVGDVSERFWDVLDWRLASGG